MTNQNAEYAGGTEELLPCPFCGGEVELKTSHILGGSDWIAHQPKIGGHDCPVAFDGFNTERNLVVAWNARPLSASTPAGSVDVESVAERMFLKHEAAKRCVGGREAMQAVLAHSGLLEEIERLKQEFASKPKLGAEMTEERAILIAGLLAAEKELIDYSVLMHIRGGVSSHWPVKAIVDALAIARQHAEIRGRGTK